MKNTYIIIAILVIVIIGGFMFAKNKTEAPTEEIDTNVNTNVEAPVTTSLPTTSTPTPVVKAFTVEGKNFSFTPSTITVNQGDTVRITFNATQGFHDFVVDGYGVATKQIQAPGTEVIEFVAGQAGTFEYYCSVGSHRQMGMKGTLVVN